MTNLNQLHNTTNPYQTDALRVLTVCSAGLLRSPTMANVLHERYGRNTRAAGINGDYALIPVTGALVYWADEIVCAEAWMADQIKKNFAEFLQPETEVVSLDIPDAFQWNAQELKEIIAQRYAERSNNLNNAPVSTEEPPADPSS